MGIIFVLSPIWGAILLGLIRFALSILVTVGSTEYLSVDNGILLSAFSSDNKGFGVDSSYSNPDVPGAGIPDVARGGMSNIEGKSILLLLLRTFLGIIGFYVIVIMFVLGIIFLIKGEIDTDIIKQQEEFANMDDEDVLYIHDISWGAFFNSFVWALGNKLYIRAILSIIPFVNIYAFVVLMTRGRELARKEGWENIQAFRQRQKLMAWIIVAIVVLSILSFYFYYKKMTSMPGMGIY